MYISQFLFFLRFIYLKREVTGEAEETKRDHHLLLHSSNNYNGRASPGQARSQNSKKMFLNLGNRDSSI